MTRSQKIALIGLVVLVLLFIAVIAVGQSQPGCSGAPQSCAAGYQPSAAIQNLSRLMAAPTAKLPQSRYVIPAHGQVQVAIPAASDKLRTLPLTLTQGSSVQLTLVDLGPPNRDLADQAKGSTLPRSASNPADQRRQTFVVSAAGAQLILRCQSSSPCVVTSD